MVASYLTFLLLPSLSVVYSQTIAKVTLLKYKSDHGTVLLKPCKCSQFTRDSKSLQRPIRPCPIWYSPHSRLRSLCCSSNVQTHPYPRACLLAIPLLEWTCLSTWHSRLLLAFEHTSPPQCGLSWPSHLKLQQTIQPPDSLLFLLPIILTSS